MLAINKSGLTGREYPLTDSLFLKFQGSDTLMKEVSEGVEKVTKKFGGKGFEFSKTEKEAADLWAGRKAALWAVMGLKEDCKVWTTDVW
jgi:D-lactate dehydrogenase (cytochrome)